MSRVIVRLFTLVFVTAAFFGLLAHPQLLSDTFKGTTSLVQAVQSPIHKG